jgi:2-polyprenyl-3-methyl-5-hydroxy-6-metoxy-1,4-benzoquinol methylase
MTTTDLAPLVAALRTSIAAHFEQRGEDLDTDSGRKTLDTNSTLAPGRADMLVEAFLARSGHSTLDGLTIADLGCGFGSIALMLAARGASVVALDPNKRRMKVGAAVAEEFGLDVRFRRATLQEPGLEAETVDLVVINNALCYLLGSADRRTALRHAHSSLRPGGWIVVRDPNRAHPRDVFTGIPLVHRAPPRVTNGVLGVFGVKRSEVRLTTPRQAVRALRRAGFVDARFDGAGGPGGRLDRFAGYHHTSARRG